MEEKLTAEWKEATLLLEDDLDHSNKDVPLEATKAGQKILKKRKKNLTKLATKLDKWKGNDREEKWIELIHHTKRKLHKVKIDNVRRFCSVSVATCLPPQCSASSVR